MTERRGNVARGADNAGEGSRRVPDAIAAPFTPQSATVPEQVANTRRHRAGGVTGLAVVTSILVLALGVSGCTGAPSPASSSPSGPGTMLPSPTTRPPSSSPSASPATVAAPERPAAMDRDDAEGAIAAATYFISLYTYAFASGELEEWKAMSDPGCVFCSGLVSDIEAASDAGTRFVGGGLTVESSEATPAEALSRFRIDLTVSQEPSETLGRSGSVTASSPGTGRATITAVLEHRSEGWLVRAANTEVPQR